MKKFLKNTALFLGVFSIFALNVNASESSFINEKGVHIDNKIVNKFEKIIDKNDFNIMSQKEYNDLSFIYNNGYSEVSVIYAERDLVENGNIIETTSSYLTEEEYERESKIQLYNNCTDSEAQACYQTSYKRLTMLLSKNASSKYFTAFVSNTWLQNPNVKSADVIALRYTGNVSINDFYGYQYYKEAGVNKNYYYNSSNANSKKFSNGVGISMNLVDAGSSFKNYLFFNGYYSDANMMIYTSYQHAKSNVSVANSKVYNLSSNGLGGVINFTNATTRSQYDAMGGVSYSLLNV